MQVETFTRYSPNAVAFKIAVALGIGMLVGFERESASKEVGMRTCGLVALLGTLSILVSHAFALAALGGVIIMTACLNTRSLLANHSLEITTSAALLVTFTLGALVGLGHSFTPVASAILMTLLLAWKLELRRFAGGVTIDELRGAVLLGLIGLVIYPLLPGHFIDPWQLVNLREAWITVVVIAGIAFVNYVLLRVYGTRGLYWTAALGGLVNNRAVIAELTHVVAGPKLMGAILLATMAMFVRNIAILALFAPGALATAIGPLLGMAAVSLLLLKGQGQDEPGRDLELPSPISLGRILKYGILFLGIQVLCTLAERAFGNQGFFAASVIGGMASSASATAAAANLAASAKIPAALAGTGAVIASMASAGANVPMVLRRGGRPVLLRVALGTALQLAVGVALLAFQRFL